jgi:hypothetical protein
VLSCYLPFNSSNESIKLYTVYTVNLARNDAVILMLITRTSGADPDPDVWDRIRILASINDPILTILVCVKAINTSGITILKLFGSGRYFLEHIFIRNISGKKLVKNLFRPGSESGSAKLLIKKEILDNHRNNLSLNLGGQNAIIICYI